MEKIYGDLVQFTEFMPSVDLALHQYLLMGDEADEERVIGEIKRRLGQGEFIF